MTPEIDHLALAVDLVIDPRHKHGVALNMERLLEQARLVMEVPLPNETEPAPVFVP